MAQLVRISWVALELPGADSFQITPDAGALVFTGKVPTIFASGSGHSLFPGVGLLAVTGKTPTLLVNSGNLTRSTGVGTLTLTGYAPSISVPGNQRVRISWLSFEVPLQDFSSSPEFLIPTASIVITGRVPLVNEFLYSITPPLGQVILTGKAPSNTYTLPSPDNAALVITGKIPTVVAVDATVINEAVLVLAGHAPEITQSSTIGPLIVVTNTALVLTTYEPTLIATGAFEVTTGLGQVTLAGYAPSVVADKLIDSAGTAAIVLTGYEPLLSHEGAWDIETATASLVINAYAPIRLNSGDPVEDGDRPAGGVVSWGAGLDHRIRSADEIDEERRRFGVLPKKVAKAVKRAARRVLTRIDTEEEARQLLDDLRTQREVAQIERAARAEMERAEIRWKNDYEFMVQAQVMHAIRQEMERRRIEDEQRQMDDRVARHIALLHEQQEISEIAPAFFRWM